MSIYSEAGDYDSVEVSGDIVFSISYDDTTQSLAVLVKECHSLAHGDARRQRSNP
jgi:synaptotagmin-like protein